MHKRWRHPACLQGYVDEDADVMGKVFGRNKKNAPKSTAKAKAKAEPPAADGTAGGFKWPWE